MKLSLLLPFYTACLLFAHAMPTESVPVARVDMAGFQINHLVHIGMFVPWGFGCVWWIRQQQHVSSSLKCFTQTVFILIVLAVPVVAESAQLLLPHRSFQITDIILNLTGTAIGALAAETAHRVWDHDQQSNIRQQ